MSRRVFRPRRTKQNYRKPSSDYCKTKERFMQKMVIFSAPQPDKMLDHLRLLQLAPDLPRPHPRSDPNHRELTLEPVLELSNVIFG